MLYSWFTGCSGSWYIHSNILESWVNGSREKFGVLLFIFLLCFAYALLYILFKLLKTSEGAGQMCPSSLNHTIGVNRHLKNLPMQVNRYPNLSLQAWFTTISRSVTRSLNIILMTQWSVSVARYRPHALDCLNIGSLWVQVQINDYKISFLRVFFS